MKKKTNATKNKKSQRQKKAAVADEPTRRDALKLARNGILGTAALGGVGWWVVTDIQAVAEEMDLSRLGQGKPSIVQIHDPRCAMCTELQRETRRALKCFDDDDLLYLVASILTDEGSAFAARHGLPHVTLVLLDRNGEVENVLEGVRQSEELKTHFESLAPRLT